MVTPNNHPIGYQKIERKTIFPHEKAQQTGISVVLSILFVHYIIFCGYGTSLTLNLKLC